MKTLALVVFVLIVFLIGAARADGITVKEAENPVMCEVNKVPVPCVYLYALLKKMRGDKPCTIRNCPHHI